MWQARGSEACLRKAGAYREVQRNPFLAMQGQGFLRPLAENRDDQNAGTLREAHPRSLRIGFFRLPGDKRDKKPIPRHCAPAGSPGASVGAIALVIVGLRLVHGKTWTRTAGCESPPAPETFWVPVITMFQVG